jgi:hypothetical protein
MLKGLFTRLFRKKRIGVCREKSAQYDYIYFTKDDEKTLEKFLGTSLDYDFCSTGVYVWMDPFVHKDFSYLCIFPTFIPYNKYVLLEKFTNLEITPVIRTYSKEEFNRLFEIVV